MLLTLLSAVANHLWQSTVFAIAASLLAVVLKKNQAQTRYWIWLAASFKFLIPFSLLINIGSHFSWQTDRIAAVEASVSAVVIGQVAQPFTSTQVTAIAAAAATKS